MTNKPPLFHLALQFTPDEFAALGELVDEGMWELVSKPHTPEQLARWERVCTILKMSGYEPQDREGERS